MKYLVLLFVIGLIAGWFIHYIFSDKAVGTIRIIDHEEATSMFLELDKELEDVRSRKKITLRVENSSYNDNQ